MDELIIGDKKFISSKRAADITGYAKDYIGQLCREGYVEAKRVGRSWYVLEAGIRDHRFGSTTPEAMHRENSPRYEALAVPSFEETQAEIRRYAAPEPVPVEHLEASAEEETSADDFHKSWESWFDTFKHAVAPEIPAQSEDAGQDESEELESKNVSESPVEAQEAYESGDDNEGVPVPIRHIERPEIHIYDARREVPRELAPRFDPPRPAERLDKRRASHGARRFVALSMTFIAIVAVVVATLGTGYFDSQLVSYQQASVIDGIISYQK